MEALAAYNTSTGQDTLAEPPAEPPEELLEEPPEELPTRLSSPLSPSNNTKFKPFKVPIEILVV